MWRNGNALDFESKDCRFDPCHGRLMFCLVFLFSFFMANNFLCIKFCKLTNFNKKNWKFNNFFFIFCFILRFNFSNFFVILHRLKTKKVHVLKFITCRSSSFHILSLFVCNFLSHFTTRKLPETSPEMKSSFKHPQTFSLKLTQNSSPATSNCDVKCAEKDGSDYCEAPAIVIHRFAIHFFAVSQSTQRNFLIKFFAFVLRWRIRKEEKISKTDLKHKKLLS